MRTLALFSLIAIYGMSCQTSDTNTLVTPEIPSGITCNEEGCEGSYYGLEFEDGTDVAHQFSNKMAKKVGDQLKKLFKKRIYVKVDLENIKMTTEDMDNKGDVIFDLSIPFKTVSDSCEASTAFDHRGGWGHEITEASVLKVFKSKKDLEFIELKTPEGLQEFWLQWQHKDWQSRCK